MTRVAADAVMVYWAGAGYYLPQVTDWGTRWHRVIDDTNGARWVDDPFDLIA